MEQKATTNSPNSILAETIPYQLLIDLRDNYIANKHKLLSPYPANQETKSIWFELDDKMKFFLRQILEDEAVSGLRIHFIQYPERQTTMYGYTVPPDPNDVNKLSVALVTTKKESEQRHPDYPENKADKMMIFAAPLNHGQLCPQKCNT